MNVTTALAHTLPGRDSVKLPDEADFSLTDTLGVAGTSQLEVTTDYSTRPSGTSGKYGKNLRGLEGLFDK